MNGTIKPGDTVVVAVPGLWARGYITAKLFRPVRFVAINLADS
jgi:hypothetical protein